jgi:hypothetical protein
LMGQYVREVSWSDDAFETNLSDGSVRSVLRKRKYGVNQFAALRQQRANPIC